MQSFNCGNDQYKKLNYCVCQIPQEDGSLRHNTTFNLQGETSVAGLLEFSKNAIAQLLVEVQNRVNHGDCELTEAVINSIMEESKKLYYDKLQQIENSALPNRFRRLLDSTVGQE